MNYKEKTIKIVSADHDVTICSNGEEYINVTIHNFPNICRFCLFGPAEINLFNEAYKNTPLTDICVSGFSIMVDFHDQLPPNICTKCEDLLKDFHCFKSSIVEVQNIFKEVLKNKNQLNYKTDIVDTHFKDISDDESSKNIEDKFEEERHKLITSCSYCSLKFNNPLELKTHLREQCKDRKKLFSTCAIREKKCSKKKLARHMKTHTKTNEQQKFQCDKCEKNYRSRRNLDRHYLIHTGMPHVCEVCGKGFREANLLKDHLNIHNGVSPYFCNVCGKSYPTSSAMRLHRLYTHTEKKRKIYKYPKKTENGSVKKSVRGSFPCEICGKVYSSKTTVNYHVLTHSEEKTFQCNDCGKMFANRSILGDHRRIHRLSYKCTYCERSFAYAASLETHINSHTGEKPHSCSICGKRYSNKSHLREHMRNHTGERPYSCTICGKTFAVKGNLNVHVKRHTKDSVHS